MNQKCRLIKLHENCHVTVGASRSIIVDMVRKTYYLIPNFLASLIDTDHVLKTDFETFSQSDKAIVTDYINFLLDNELAFYCDEVDQFPTMNLEWGYPAKITNAIFEISREVFQSRYEVMKKMVSDCLTRHIEVFIIEPLQLTDLDDFFNKLDQLDLNNYNVIFSLLDNKDLEKAIIITKQHYKAFRCIIYNAGKNDVITANRGGWNNVFLLAEPFSYKFCGVINTDYFSTNIEHVSESQDYNTCLNRKMAIDIDGNVRNCPSMKAIHGNIGSVNITDLINMEHFQFYWTLNKDKIAVCKDCEFRNICTDCRAYIDTPEDIYSKPLKCGYSPYTNKWEDWSTNPLKQEVIKFYSL